MVSRQARLRVPTTLLRHEVAAQPARLPSFFSSDLSL